MCGVRGGSRIPDLTARPVTGDGPRHQGPPAQLLEFFLKNNAPALQSLKAYIQRWRDAARSNSEPLAVAVGIEYAYPHVAIYDYEQLLAAYLLSLWLEAATADHVGIVLVGSDSTEVNRYNINPLFREYFAQRHQLAHVVADLIVDPSLREIKMTPHAYLAPTDLAIIGDHAATIDDSTSYVTFIRSIKMAALSELPPFDTSDFSRRVKFCDFPVSAFRHGYREELGRLLLGIRGPGGDEDASSIPIQAYRLATGKTVSASSALGDDPFVAFCPQCGAGSSRVIESHYYPTKSTLKYHCLKRERRLYPNYQSGISDNASGCGLRYTLRTDTPSYFADDSGNLSGYPRFALASVVAEWPIWVMESTDVVSGGLLTSMTNLRKAHSRGLLGWANPPITPLAIACCRLITTGMPRDASIFNVALDERERLSNSVQLDIFSGS